MYKVGDILKNKYYPHWGSYQIKSITETYNVVNIDNKNIGFILFSLESDWQKVNKFSVGDKVRLIRYPEKTGKITKVISKIAKEYYSDDSRISYEDNIGGYDGWSWENDLELIENSESAAIPKYKLGQEVYNLGVKCTIFSIIHRADGIFYDVTSHGSRFHSLPESDLLENDKNEIKVGDAVDLSAYYTDVNDPDCNFIVKKVENGVLTVETIISMDWVKKT